MKKALYTFGAFFILFFVVIFLISCSKNSDEYKKAKATIVWKGDPAACGCGFFVKIKGKDYKPENESIIGDEFKTTEETTVTIEYQLLEKNVEIFCGDSPTPTKVDKIEIISISKKV